MSDTLPDVTLYLDPVCPFCWQTSRWLRQVERLAAITVEHRFISLARLNDVEVEVPADTASSGAPGLADVQRRGALLLRVLAAARQHGGNAAVGRLYDHLGAALFETAAPGDGSWDAVLAYQATAPHLPTVLAAAGLPAELADAVDDRSHDTIIAAETDEALARAGDQVGTPVLGLGGPDGPAFFGPVIAELPPDARALELYRAVTLLAGWPGFAELKRSLRALPDLPVLGGVRDG